MNTATQYDVQGAAVVAGMLTVAFFVGAAGGQELVVLATPAIVADGAIGTVVSDDSVIVEEVAPTPPLLLDSAVALAVAGAQVRLEHLFAGDTLVLSGEIEPDDPDGLPYALLTIHTRREPADVMALLNKFDEEWWLGARRELAGKLEIVATFV